MPPRLSPDGPNADLYRPDSAHWRVFPVDRLIAGYAARQHGVVSMEQLLALDVGERAVRRRVETGRLHRVHQRAYAVGHPPLSREAWFMAAVLACGPEAVLSHRSAAELWGICTSDRQTIDVTAPNRRGRAPSGIAAHRDGSLMKADRTVLKGIPCTTVSRTLLDLAGVVPIAALRKAIAEAEVLRTLDHAAVRHLVKRSRGRRGVARLRMLLDEIHPQTKRTRSEMERLFLRMCARTELPEPEVNVGLDVAGVRLMPDFLWRDACLIVEADSRRYHDTDSAFQHDRRREQRLMLAGWRVARCTWEQVEREPHQLSKTIRRLLDQANNLPMGRKRTHSDRIRPMV